MQILGPDEIVFGVDDVEACRTYLKDYGLAESPLADGGFRFEALDGTAMSVFPRDAAHLPAPLASGNTLRLTVWGCADQATVDDIEAELSRDREVVRRDDGSLLAVDDVGFPIGFRVTRRHVELVAERVNSPGAAPARSVNAVAANRHTDAKPRTLSHVVYFTPDMERMERFYAERLKFTVTDRFNHAGPFMRPQANDDHHCLFMLQTPPHMQGLEHVAFHMAGPTEMMLAGSRMVEKGYESFWGPGRHNFGSNWFWYFNSPLGVHIEYDADMDKHDASWEPRVADPNSDTSQMFLFENVEKWSPGGPPPPRAALHTAE